MAKFKNNNKAFTLIELLIAIAIVGILATAVLVSTSSYGERARASRAMAQASSVIPSLVSCWGNGELKSDAPGNICSGKDGYGQWPTLPTDYSFSAVSGTSASAFHFTVTGESQTICCNSAMSSCGILESGSCIDGTTW